MGLSPGGAIMIDWCVVNFALISPLAVQYSVTDHCLRVAGQQEVKGTPGERGDWIDQFMFRPSESHLGCFRSSACMPERKMARGKYGGVWRARTLSLALMYVLVGCSST